MIKFNDVEELKTLLERSDKRNTYILPLNSDGRLGFPIAYSRDSKAYAQLKRSSYTNESMLSVVKELPNEGWVLVGEAYTLKVSGAPEVEMFHFSAIEFNVCDNKPESLELKKFIYESNEDGKFDIDDKIVVDIIKRSTEFKVKIHIGWVDTDSTLSLWLNENIGSMVDHFVL